MSKKLEDYSKEELIETITHLKKRKKFGLVWEDKPEDVVSQCKKELPVLEQNEKIAMNNLKDAPTNLIIEGDNYHALSVLNYTHANKIDVIYIDPPYNTGNTEWKYNNDYVDSEDVYKHSKWASFMSRRLRLAKNLLTKDGIMVVTIDNYEVHTLRMLLEDILPSREIITTVIEYNHRGRAKNNFALTHEYALWAIPKDKDLITRKTEYANDAVLNLRRTGQNSLRQDRPSMFYGILVNKESLKIIDATQPIIGNYKPEDLNSDKGIALVLPIDRDGTERRWYYGRERLLAEAKTGGTFAKKVRDKIEINFKFAGKPKRRKSVWIGAQYDASSHGTVLLNQILGRDMFSFPKSIWAVKECLESASSKKDAIILDYFAGSGTTGHAALLLNQEDGGNRQFILCTNNENNIAEAVAYPRIKKVIQGYNNTKGIPANLRYFKTAFVSKSSVSDDTRYELVKRSCDMICVREETYESVSDKPAYKIFENSSHYTVILFDIDKIQAVKDQISKLSDQPVHLYVFTLTNDSYDNDFSDIKQPHKLCPIPESILEVYRKIFKEKPIWN